MRLNQIKSIVLNAYECNSYQVVEIYVNNSQIHKSKIFYGYGDQYTYYALEWLKKYLFSEYVNKNKINNCSSFWHLRDTLNIVTLDFKCYTNNTTLNEKSK